MSVRRYDLDSALADVFVAYMAAKLDAALLKVSPAITIFDPMATEEANRFISEVKGWKTDPASPGVFSGTVKCTTKSRWSKPTWQADRAAHYDRFNWMADVLMSNTLADDLTALAVGFVVDFIQPSRNFTPDVREGFIYSEVIISFNGHWTE